MLAEIIHIMLTLSWLAFILYWILLWQGNKKTMQRAGWLWRTSAFAILVMFLVLDAKLGIGMRQIFPSSTVLAVVGTLIAVAGASIAVWARRTLGTNWSANPAIKENHELIVSGPYQYVRHPIYSGILLLLLGTALADNTQSWVIGFLGGCVICIVKMRIEESLMKKQFGDAYVSYMRRVKALVPFIF